MIKHFTATAVVHDPHGRVLLLLHKAFGRWMCPGGHMEPNEPPNEAVLREVLEETGLRVRFLSNGERYEMQEPRLAVLPTPFCVVQYQVAPKHTHVDFVYRCIALEEDALCLNTEESHDLAWFEPQEIATWGPERIFLNVQRLIQLSAERFYSEQN
ncbi:MAG: NUDIX domain-containing protein [Clostridia bacterium]|nr:NUDIX domain-containing protein [Clostridia bacterium]